MTIKSIYQKFLPEKSRLRIRQLYTKIKSPIYFGKNYYCNICQKGFRKFLPKGDRKNARCPYCSSLERTRLLDLYLQKEINFYTKSTIKLLHFGPEEALFNKIKHLNIEYIDADINPAFARHAEDITKISFPDNYFDYIICSHVLGELPVTILSKATSELFRVLKPTGIAFVIEMVPVLSDEIYKHIHHIKQGDDFVDYRETILYKQYGKEFLKPIVLLEQGGFKVECIDYRNQLQSETVLKNVLGNSIGELICVSTK